MKKFALALVACSVLSSGAALGQTATPAPAAKAMSVPQDAAFTYNLIGLNVYDGANDDVGQIKDLVLENGTLVGYILSVGGFLGMGEHYVAVTPGSIGLAYNDTDKKWKASINVTKDQLKAAPQFTYSGKFNR
jgi:hypothetical protein